MKKHIAFFLFLVSILSNCFSQSYTLYNSDFSTTTGWNLGHKTNRWVINSVYTCAGTLTTATPNNGNGGYLHVFSETSLPLYGGTCACYNPTATAEVIYANTTQNISTIGYDSVTISFDWLCKGNTNNYGNVQFSTDGGNTFTPITSPTNQFYNQSTWTNIVINSGQNPGLLNKAQLMIRFVFTSGATRNTPGFSIDNLYVKGFVTNPQFNLSSTYVLPEQCGGSKTGKAVLLATGGTRPYTYVWKNSLNQTLSGVTDSVATNLGAGSYTAIAYDNAGHSDTVSFSISNLFGSPDIVASENDTICANQTSQLTATGGTYYTWTPTSQIQGSSTISNPIAHPTVTTQYIVHGDAAVGDYITNGDFAAGNSGFYSEYTFYSANTQDMSEGKYTVRPEPSTANSAWWPCNWQDHTSTGDGNMLVVNGTNVANTSIWCETVTVTPNTNYAFSTWLTSMHTLNPAVLQFSINSELIGSSFNATSNVCEWNQFYQLWNSGNNTSATICVVNMNTVASGNDFALDDISFSPLCGENDTVIVAISQPVAFAGNDTSFCGATPITLTAQGGVNYQWNTSPIQNTQQISVNPATNTNYTVTVTDRFGCTATDAVAINVGIMPIVNLGNDTTLCQGNTLIINALNSTINSYLWNDGSVGTSKTINSAGTYWLKGTSSCGAVTDTIHVYYSIPAPINLGNDTTICTGNSVTLTAPAGFSNYLWSTGATGTTINVNSTAQIWLRATNSYGCKSYDTLNVTSTSIPTVNLGNDTIVCNRDSIQLTSSGFASYLWSTGATTNSIWIKNSGNYILTVTTAGNCGNKDTIHVQFSYPPAIHLGNDTTICLGNSVTLTAPAGFSNYLWSTGATGTTLNVNSTAQVWLKGTDSYGCKSYDTLNVTSTSTPSVNLGNDTVVCNRDSIQLISSGFASYLWSTGETTSSIWVKNSGNYSLAVTAAGNCGNKDTVHVQFSYPPAIHLGNDTTICLGNSVTLTAPAGFNEYLWSTGDVGTSITVNISAQVWLKATDLYGCKSYDTLGITSTSNPNINLGNDTIVCGSDSIRLSTNGNFISYLWNTGSTTNSIWAKNSGTYTLSVTAAGNCGNSDSIHVQFSTPPTLNLGNDTTICSGNSITLSAPSGYNNYLWSNGTTSTSLQVSANGVYWLEVSNSDGCKKRDYIQITFSPLAPISLGLDIDFCGLTSTIIDAGPRQDVNCTFLWSDGSTNVSSIIANQAGIYWVRYGNNLCAVSDTIELYNCPELTVPNVFTPNGDGFNDLFIPEAQSISTFKMTIYNRWGEKIFTTEDYIHGWDGTISKNEAADGVYFWVIEYKERGNQSDSKVLYGSVTLIR